MAISYEARPKFASRNDEIIAGLRESAGASPPSDPKMVIKRKTAEVATAMALLHGGDWKVRVDHEAGLVLIARREPPLRTV